MKPRNLMQIIYRLKSNLYNEDDEEELFNYFIDNDLYCLIIFMAPDYLDIDDINQEIILSLLLDDLEYQYTIINKNMNLYLDLLFLNTLKRILRS